MLGQLNGFSTEQIVILTKKKNYTLHVSWKVIPLALGYQTELSPHPGKRIVKIPVDWN